MSELATTPEAIDCKLLLTIIQPCAGRLPIDKYIGLGRALDLCANFNGRQWHRRTHAVSQHFIQHVVSDDLRRYGLRLQPCANENAFQVIHSKTKTLYMTILRTNEALIPLVY